MKKVLFFFPQKPYPPETGAHKRCVQLLGGLRDLGCQINFASSAYRNLSWTNDAVQHLKKHFGCDVNIFHPSIAQRGVSAGIDYIKKLACPREDRPQYLMSFYARSWFSNISTEYEPDILFVNYATYDALVDWEIHHYCNSIIEMHDLITVNRSMRLLMKKEVGAQAIITGRKIDKILDLDYYNKRQFSANPSEYRIYDKYKYTICISKDEKNKVAVNTQNTTAVHIPMTHEVQYINNKYEAEALFCVGPNPFNSQGYYYFVNNVLPVIHKKRPDFNLKITGYFYENSYPRLADGISYSGFVDDLKPVYELARFFICPVFGGTGQQVKIVEAMAHGLPVVAFKNAAIRSPIRHGINGLVANSAEEFAEHVLTLWCDKSLCKKLGDAARFTIASELNEEQLLRRLDPLLRQ
jgi:glycosyltransferase involved in cell wall biosynthesis